MICRRTMKAFTLVETMVAIAVLAIALIGPFLAVDSARDASYVARDELIASSLAQEGMEYVRSVRDDNYLNSRSWMTGLSSLSCYGSNPGSNYCTVDPTQGDPNIAGSKAITAYSSLASVHPLYLSSTNLYNQQDTGVATRFTRVLQLKFVSATEVQPTVTVYWTSAHQTYSITVTDTLRDWL